MKNKKSTHQDSALLFPVQARPKPELEKFYQQLIKSFGYEYQRKA